MSRGIIRHGFILILLASVTGLIIPSLTIPRLGLTAHTVGMLSGTLLIAIGAVWSQLRLSQGQLITLYWCWLYVSYANWLGCLVGGMTGAGKMTPIAASGSTGSLLAEAIVGTLLITIVLVTFVGIGLAVYGLRCERENLR